MRDSHDFISLSSTLGGNPGHSASGATAGDTGAASLLTGTLPRSVDEALAAAVGLGSSAPALGSGDTFRLWEALATLASADLAVARVVEPHLDALAILHQAGPLAFPLSPGSTWGVFAAEGGNEPLAATAGVAGDWTLSGVKPWCSLADRLDAALVTATLDSGERRLFAVDLHHPGVDVIDGAWVARGLTEIPSGPVRFTGVPAQPVGEAGWYLERPGFSWGAIGVAACWYGGAVGLARTLFAAASSGTADRIRLMHLGAVDELLQSARRALAEAAALVDAGAATGPAGRLLAKRVRATVARASEEVLVRVGHTLGPAPLALDADHSKRVADLQLYLRQHHAERDEASLGESIVRDGSLPW